jgi:Scaffold protein Nfu/NifU N terminal
MFIQTEATPNPATLKFLPGRAVLEAGTLDMPNKEAATQSPLAERLFDIPNVGGVFYGSDFISVTKSDGEWQQIKPAILGAIMEHYMSGAALVAADAAPAQAADDEFFDAKDADRRHHQGPDRDPGAPGGGRRRRRHHLPRLQGRDRLPANEGRLFRLPVLDRDAPARHPEPAQAFRARRG